MELRRRLDLKKAIILGDYQRLEKGEAIINSLRNLSRELVVKFPERYNVEDVCELVHEAHRYGTNDDQLINDIEKLTGISQRVFIKEL